MFNSGKIELLRVKGRCNMDPQKKIGCLQGCLSAVAILIALIIGIVVLIILGLRGCDKKLSEMDSRLQGDKNWPVDVMGGKYKEQWSAGVDKADALKVVRISLDGVISRESDKNLGIFKEIDASSAVVVRDKIRAAKCDENVKAIIIEINSPGGEVTMSDLIWHELKEFKSSSPNRKVFAYLMDMACSGGYYVACAADYIYALPTTITGSIGVIIPAFNASALAEKIGVKPVTIASSKNKDLLNPLMPTDPEHVSIVKKAVDESYERFVDIVCKARALSLSDVKEIADGRILSAKDALSSKLIDGIVYEEDFLGIVEKALGGEIKVVKYEMDSFFGNYFLDGLMMRVTESVKRSITTEISRPTTMQYR